MIARGYKFYLRVFNSRCRVEHEKIKFISTSGHVISSIYYINILMTTFFDDFPKISDRFLKISEDFPKLFGRKDELFRTFFGHFPKITEIFEDNRRFPRRDR